MQRTAYRRAYGTFVQPSSLRFVRPPPPPKPSPSSPSFFAGNYNFQDKIISLETIRKNSERTLRAANILPVPPSLSLLIPQARPAWKKLDDFKNVMDSRVKMGQYRKVLKLLGELQQLRAVAQVSGKREVDQELAAVLKPFQKEDLATSLFGEGELNGFSLQDASVKKKNKIDEVGRSYALGKRKESSARVWIIPTNTQSTSAPPAEGSTASTSLMNPQTISELPTTSILINNLPLATYFPLPADREKITRPFKLTGTLGGFNVFAITRGGGSSGQAGAVAHGISKALLSQLPDLRKILSKGMSDFHALRSPAHLCFPSAQLLKRDPRMVERKKTGLAKARKRVRVTISNLLAIVLLSYLSVRMGQTLGLFLFMAIVSTEIHIFCIHTPDQESLLICRK